MSDSFSEIAADLDAMRQVLKEYCRLRDWVLAQPWVDSERIVEDNLVDVVIKRLQLGKSAGTKE